MARRQKSPRKSRPLRRWQAQLPLLLVAVAVLSALHALDGADLTPKAKAPSADETLITGRPTKITDGDTFRIGETRIRLDGVDAPEMSTRQGEPARRHLARLIGSGSVRCFDEGERSYDRIVAICYNEDGHDLAEAMVRDGWATDWARYSGGRYASLEADAMRDGRGMH